jgi:hypothetical protein
MNLLEDDSEDLEVPARSNELEFWEAIWRSSRQPMNRRMKAAELAAQYKFAKRTATAVTIDGSFAERLERCWRRSQGDMKLIKGKVVQHDAGELWPGADE